MLKLCECGCGQPVGIARQTRAEYGHVKGQPFRFKGGHQRRLLAAHGYPCRQKASGQRGVKEVHLARAEQALGKRLPHGAHVHHVDLTKSPTSPLVICQSSAYHQLLHIRTRVVKAGGNPNTERVCLTCGALKPTAAFVQNQAHYCGVRAVCKDCFNAARRRRRRYAAA